MLYATVFRVAVIGTVLASSAASQVAPDAAGRIASRVAGGAPTQSEWNQLARLLGAWVADTGSGGKPGAAIRGGETWSTDLENHVLVRRDHSEYAATLDRAAFRHDGLMVLARAAGEWVAHSFDNEGHVIDYRVMANDTAVVFTSSADASMPQFRLTYRPRGAEYVETFEIAPPGHAGAFQPYVAGRLRRAP